MSRCNRITVPRLRERYLTWALPFTGPCPQVQAALSPRRPRPAVPGAPPAELAELLRRPPRDLSTVADAATSVTGEVSGEEFMDCISAQPSEKAHPSI